MTKNNVDIDKLLGLLAAHKMYFMEQLLRSYDLKITGNKEDLIGRIRKACISGQINPEKVLSYLDEIEGWGNQHVYLYSSPNQKLISTWRDRSKVEKILKDNNCIRLLNKSRSVLLPEKPTLSSIVWNPNQVRLVWTLKRTWEERLEEEDDVSDDTQVIWKAYAKKKARATLAFDWHLGSGDAMVMIQRLPSGTKYSEERDILAEMMLPILDLSEFQPVRISRAIKKISEADVVRVRKNVMHTPAGGGASFRSSGKNKAVKDDPILKQAEKLVASKSIGEHGNYYWLTDSDSNLKRDLHVTLHAKDQRIGLYGERLESEVRYVIGCIRSYC